jgi:hypothetical protein
MDGTDAYELIAILKKMCEDFDFLFVGRDQAHWRQEPYRSDFFAAFTEVYHVAPMNGEQVETFFKDQHLRRSDPRYDEKMGVLEEICDAWTEWEYAWRKHSET